MLLFPSVSDFLKSTLERLERCVSTLVAGDIVAPFAEFIELDRIPGALGLSKRADDVDELFI